MILLQDGQSVITVMELSLMSDKYYGYELLAVLLLQVSVATQFLPFLIN